MIGWKDERAVELALRSIDLAVNHRAELVLCGAAAVDAGSQIAHGLAMHRANA